MTTITLTSGRINPRSAIRRAADAARASADRVAHSGDRRAARTVYRDAAELYRSVGLWGSARECERLARGGSIR